jgi:hypothetical protein
MWTALVLGLAKLPVRKHHCLSFSHSPRKWVSNQHAANASEHVSNFFCSALATLSVKAVKPKPTITTLRMVIFLSANQ